MTRKLIALLAAAIIFFPALVTAAPEARLWSIWNTSDEQSDTTISHAKWQALLDRYLDDNTADGVNLFAYSTVSNEDKQILKAYIKELTALDPRDFNKAEQFAYWVNLYNALTVDLVLKKYPVASIRKIRFLSSPFGPWNKSLVKIAGERITLNDIEHRILRPIWRDERIHFAVNCASIGCPNLQGNAFTAANADQLLEKGAREFINHPRGVMRNGDALMLSSIFDWYGADFADSQDGVVKRLEYYMDAPGLSALQGFTSLNYDYDWSLNQAQ